MARLIWTDQAINDLDDIGDYIAENSLTYAKLTVQKLYEKTCVLHDFPRIGRIVPEKNDEILENSLRGVIESYMRSFQMILSTS